MAGKQERGLVSGIKNVVSWAKDIVSGIMDHINDAIDEALSNDDEEGLSEADIVDMTMNDIIESMPDLVAGDEVTTAIEGAVYDTLQQAGVPQVQSVSEDDDRVCERCLANQEAGPVPIGSTFPTGDSVPPYHNRCRCNIVAVRM